MNKFLKIREKNAKFWKKSLAEYSAYITFLEDETKSYNSNMLFAIKITKNKFFTKDQLVNFLENKGIGTRPVMAGNFVKHPVIKIIPHRISGNLKNSSEIMENAFLIGNHQNIGDNERKYISKTIIKFLNSKIK